MVSANSGFALFDRLLVSSIVYLSVSNIYILGILFLYIKYSIGTYSRRQRGRIMNIYICDVNIMLKCRNINLYMYIHIDKRI